MKKESNIPWVYIKLPNCYLFFSLRSILKLLECTQNNETIFVIELITLLAVLPKIYFSTSTFQNFCSDLFCSYLYWDFRNFTNFCFPENLLVAATNRFKVTKIFISLKVTVYIQDRRLRSEKVWDAFQLAHNVPRTSPYRPILVETSWTIIGPK